MLPSFNYINCHCLFDCVSVVWSICACSYWMVLYVFVCYECVMDVSLMVVVLSVLMSSVWCMVLFCTGAVLLMHHIYDVPDAVMIHH